MKLNKTTEEKILQLFEEEIQNHKSSLYTNLGSVELNCLECTMEFAIFILGTLLTATEESKTLLQDYEKLLLVLKKKQNYFLKQKTQS